MSSEWLPPVISGLLGAGGIAAGYGGLRQLTRDMKESMTALVTQNREDHQRLFEKIELETRDRSNEDKDIREKYVTFTQCQMMRGDKANGKAFGAGAGRS